MADLAAIYLHPALVLQGDQTAILQLELDTGRECIWDGRDIRLVSTLRERGQILKARRNYAEIFRGFKQK